MMNSITMNEFILSDRLRKTVDVVDRIELENSIVMLRELDDSLEPYTPVTATNSRYC
ncbi:hypothetical protein ES708_26515 [subsurface metagenome]